MTLFNNMLKDTESLFLNPIALDYDYHPNKVMRGVKYIRKIVYIHPIRSRQVAATIIAYCGEFI